MSAHNGAISLADTLRRQLIWIGLAMAVCCLLLTFSFAISLIDLTSNNLMQLEAETIIRQHQHNPEQPLPRSPIQSAWYHWQDIPQATRQLFDNQDIVPGKPLEAITLSASGQSEYVYLMHYQTGSESLYLVNRHSAEELEATFFNLLAGALTRSSAITLLILIPLFILIAWLIRRMLEPLKLLSDWSARLNTASESEMQEPEQGRPSVKDPGVEIHFPISELNQIAHRLCQGINRVRAANQREQTFLKHASHELRTPLAVIQASLDTLNLQTEEHTPADRSVQRALKASHRMIQLSETLLWLARDSDKTIPRQPVAIRSLCQQLIQDHRYLLNNRSVAVQWHSDEDYLEIEGPLLSIVFSNLIRNAFQHCSDGAVEIRVEKQSLTIINTVQDPIGCESSGESSDESGYEPGFGLGLQLVQKICQKLGWQFEFHPLQEPGQPGRHYQASPQVQVRVGWPASLDLSNMGS